jgi:hypothetical protein
MKDHYDPWYVRLPDGHIVKAKSTASVRHHVEAGNIPLNSTARRHSDEEWVGLAWITEFADLGGGPTRNHDALTEIAPTDGVPPSPEAAPKSGVAARLDPLRLQTVGIRGLVEELIAAFDSTVSGGKLAVAGIVAAVGALATFLVMRGALLVYAEGAWLAQVLSGSVALLALATIAALLTRQTHLELSRMRPVSQAEARAGAGGFILRVFLGYVATIGVGIGIILLLQHVPGWTVKTTASASATVSEAAATAAWAVALLLAVVVFATMLLSLLVAPVLIVEECSLGDAIREWRSILREHRLRVVVYEGMALAVATVAALPVAAPVWLALYFGPQLPPAAANWVTLAVPEILLALAAAPALAFLVVANLFIYLNLRYEHTPPK